MVRVTDNGNSMATASTTKQYGDDKTVTDRLAFPCLVVYVFFQFQ